MIAELPSGVRIGYDRVGDPEATPLVLLHGLSSSRLMYEAVLAHLADGAIAGGALQVLNVDLRGHGESTHMALEEYRAGDFAADIAELIELTVGRPAIVAGHSLGGVVAASLGSLRPDLVRGLFLEDPPLFEGDDERRASSPVASIFPQIITAVRQLQASNASADDYMATVMPGTPPNEAAARCQGLTTWDPTTMQAAIDGIVWHGFSPAASFGCPVTILRADPAFGAVFHEADGPLVSAANPHARIVMVPGSAHSINSAATLPAYLAHLDAFIASVR